MAQDKDIQNTSATTIALMERFETVDDLANADMDELIAFITRVGHGRFAGQTVTAKALRTAARGSYRLTKRENDTVLQTMHVSIVSMRALKEQVKVLDKAIKNQFEIIPNILTSISELEKSTTLVLSLKSVVFTASIPKPLSLSLSLLPGHSTSPMN